MAASARVLGDANLMRAFILGLICGTLFTVWAALFAGAAFGAQATSQFPEPPITEHNWIQKNKDYKLREPDTETHCCSQNHCRALNPGQVIRMDDGGYVILASPPFITKEQYFPESKVYYTEAEGEGQYWACVVQNKVRCLFVPALGF
jgi:hypothetical protein